MRRLYWALNVAAKIAAFAVWPHSRWTAFALFTGPDYWLLYAMFAPRAQFACRVVTGFRPDPGARSLWLTIDDGPDPEDTPRILALLRRHQARATFFVIGQKARAHPELVRAILAEGHEVAHHTDTHPVASFWLAGPSRLARELDPAQDALRAAGAAARVFRPPVGIKSLFLGPALRRRGLVCVGWSIRSGDCRSQRVERPLARILAAIRPGAIVLLHEGPSVPPPIRVRLIADLLAGLSERGYGCVIPSPDRWMPPAPTAEA